MRVCFLFFVCVVLVASAIARPGTEGKRARRNQPVYEDEIDDREPREQSHQEFLDDFFNGKPIRQNYGGSWRVTKNAAESMESDEQFGRESSESDEDDTFEDSEEEDQDGDSEEETGGYDDNEIDDVSREQSDGRKRAPSPYFPRVQEPEEYVDIDDDVSEPGRRPLPPWYKRPVEQPRQYDGYDERIQRSRESKVQGQGTQSRSEACAIYCSRPKMNGSAYAQVRAMCGCGDQMQYKK